MATIVPLRPLTPGQRGRVVIKNRGLYQGRPVKSLTSPKVSLNGRNNQGRITTRHRGGRGRLLYRLVDFHRTMEGVPARVARIEYDPNRTAHIALLKYNNGAQSYVIAQQGMKVGTKVLNGPSEDWTVGNSMKLEEMPLGSEISCLELHPGSGAKIARSAGAACRLMAKDNGYATVRLRSGEVRRFSLKCRATLGVVSNGEHFRQKLGKAGVKRWMGIRPTVRGVAMNPVDHPHGGGEGRTSSGRHPVSPWGTLAKGYRTRKKNKSTNQWIVSRRRS